MSIYSGKDELNADIIATAGNRKTVIAVIKKHFLPKIGQIKFLLRKNYEIQGLIANNGIYNDITSDFNGWVFPDGSLYSKECFLEAYSVFGDRYGLDTDTDDTAFRIPTLQQYLKLYPIAGYATSEITAKSSIEQHNHTLNSIVSYSADRLMTNVFSFYSRSGGGVGKDGYSKNDIPNVHNGSGKYRDVYKSFKIELEADFSLLDSDTGTYNDGIENKVLPNIPECEPIHRNVITLIYIGKQNIE